jgi:signal transduction histidine kinase/AmiR/NasT family two-component response regulator
MKPESRRFRATSTLTCTAPVAAVATIVILGADFNATLSGIAGAALVLVLVSAFLIQRRIIRSIVELTRFAETFDAVRGTHERVRVDGKAETDALAAAMNAMLDRIVTERNATQRAQLASEAKSAFLANMSHEIRTPMTAILGYIDLLQASGLSEAEHRKAFDTLKRNGEHLVELVNDILDLSKIEAGKQTVEQSTFSPLMAIADVQSLMHARAAAKGLPLSIEFEGPLPETITGDIVRLRQILINLVGNAIKFTDQGSVRLITRLVQSSDSQADTHYLQFEVRDTGIGIHAEGITKLFEPFSQLDRSDTRRQGGTGLGLCISKRLARLLGGDITVTSEPGVGSTFIATVAIGPLAAVQLIDRPALTVRASAERILPPELKLPPCRVLFAEDGIDNQRLIGAILKKAGAATVTVVENGLEAVEQAVAAYESRVQFDLILMDMQMPVMDGYRATRELRAMGYDGPIVALTAHAMEGERQKCLDCGCDDYISKPIDRVAFLKTVRSYVHDRPRERRDQNPIANTPTTATNHTLDGSGTAATLAASAGAGIGVAPGL